MAWQAPNLLGMIFERPQVPDSQVLQNFMSGFVGGREQAKQNKNQDALDQMAYGDTAAGVMTPEPKRNWLEETVKGIYLGKQMQDPLKYQQAKLQNQNLAARAIGETLDNRLKQKELDDSLSAKGEITQWMERYDTPDKRRDAVLPVNPTARKYALDMQHADSQSFIEQGKIIDNISFSKSLAEIDPEDRAMIREMIPNKDGTPSPQQLKVLSIAQQKIQSRLAAAKESAAMTAPSVLAAQIRADATIQKAAQAEFTPGEPVTFKDGSKLIHVSPQRWQYVKANKVEEMSDSQMLSLAKTIDDKTKRDGILNALISKAEKQLAPKTEPEPAKPTPAATPTVTNQSEYDALPPNSVYIGRDGKPYRKP